MSNAPSINPEKTSGTPPLGVKQAMRLNEGSTRREHQR
jgi:hypothetical protein